MKRKISSLASETKNSKFDTCDLETIILENESEVMKNDAVDNLNRKEIEKINDIEPCLERDERKTSLTIDEFQTILVVWHENRIKNYLTTYPDRRQIESEDDSIIIKEYREILKNLNSESQIVC